MVISYNLLKHTGGGESLWRTQGITNCCDKTFLDTRRRLDSYEDGTEILSTQIQKVRVLKEVIHNLT